MGDGVAMFDSELRLAAWNMNFQHGARAQDQNFNITLERDFSEAIAPVELVPQDVTRVFLNLIGSGFYAANKRLTAGDAMFKPVLRVTTRDLADVVGIRPELRDKLFQQADRRGHRARPLDQL